MISNNLLNQDLRTLRLAYALIGRVRESVHFDPIEKKTYRYLDRGLSLDKYKGRQDVFGTFTSVFKLGINPSSRFNTPIGIYSYPIDFLISNYRSDKGIFDVPFPSTEKQVYLTIFSADISKCLVFNPGEDSLVNKYRNRVSDDEADLGYRHSMRVLNKLYGFLQNHLDQTTYEEYRDFAYREVGIFAYLTGMKFDHGLIENIRVGYGLTFESFEEMQISKQLPDEDKYEKLISEDLKSRSIDKPIQFPYEDRLERLAAVVDMKNHPSKYAYDSFKSKILAPDQRLYTDQAFVWNFTRHLSGFRPKIWAMMLYRMGFIGAIDHGTETIHGNEPTQAVFFEKSSLKTLEVISNQIKQHNLGRDREESHKELSNWTRKEQGIRDARYQLDPVFTSLMHAFNFVIFKNNIESDGSLNFQLDLIKRLKKIFMLIGWFRVNAPDDYIFLIVKRDLPLRFQKVLSEYSGSLFIGLENQLNLVIKALKK